jgi:hypothetical protein
MFETNSPTVIQARSIGSSEPASPIRPGYDPIDKLK